MCFKAVNHICDAGNVSLSIHHLSIYRLLIDKSATDHDQFHFPLKCQSCAKSDPPGPKILANIFA